MCISAPAPIPKKARARFNAGLFPMTQPLLPEDKLAALRAADSRRKWISLDDQRVCVLCDRVITGRQIEVKRTFAGVWSVQCPTPGCPAVPSDWFYQGTGYSSNPATLRMGEANLWGA
jgi:hypothetical protein